MDRVYLIRDVLDDQLIDRKKRPLGKVDGVIIVLRKEKPPRVAYLETGLSTVAHRLSPRLGRFTEKIGRKWGMRRGKPFRIPWAKVRKSGIDVEVDLDADETPVMDWEKWLNRHIIGRIPWAG
jgi:hypothetical protein